MERDAVVDLLNDLILRTEDSHLGLQHAAGAMPDAPARDLLTDLAARRAAMVRDLQARVAALGGAPEGSGTLMGGARRLMEDIGSAIGARNREDILSGLLHQEEEVLKHFRQAGDRHAAGTSPVESASTGSSDAGGGAPGSPDAGHVRLPGDVAADLAAHAGRIRDDILTITDLAARGESAPSPDSTGTP